MKCDELKVYHCNEWHNEYTEFNLKLDVDAAIDELKAAHHKERHEYIKMIAELNAEINRKEDMEKRWFKRCMEARAENVKLRRALWLARAERARDKALVFYFAMTESCNLNINGYSNEEKGHIRMRPARWWRITWLKVERKCRAKEDEYK